VFGEPEELHSFESLFTAAQTHGRQR